MVTMMAREVHREKDSSWIDVNETALSMNTSSTIAGRFTMKSLSVHSPSALSRRLALGRVGAAAAALGLSLGAARGRAAAQEAATDLANHPLTGTWLAMANPALPDDPQFPAPSLFTADGVVLLVFPTTQVGPQGVVFNAPAMGTWEADGDRRGHFTAVQLQSDANGVFLGSVTIDGYPEVSEDGQTFADDGSRAVITIRDAAGAIVQEVSGVFDRPVTAIRIGVGSPGFPESANGGATPTA